MCSSYFFVCSSFCVDQKLKALIVEKFLSFVCFKRLDSRVIISQHPDLSLQHHGERTENCERYSGE